MKKINLGIIGTGIAARNLHLPALQKLKSKFNIKAVCNHTEKKAKEFSHIAGEVPYTLDYKDILADPSIDAVDIILPLDLNYKVTRDALKAGKHVIVEKPLAANMKEANLMLDLKEKYKDSIVMVAENFRYRKVFEKAKKHIENGLIGSPYSVIWNVFYFITADNEYAKTKWRKNHKYPGGFLTDAGVHNIAAIRYLLGDINSCFAFTKSINKKIGSHDTMSVQFDMNNNISGLYNLYFSVNGNWNDQLLIFGEKGTIEILMNKLIVKRDGKKDKVEEWNDDHGYYAELLNFYNAIRNGETIVSSVEEAYKDLKVVLGALRSAEQKRIIKFY
ncbi:MAG: Gfo/Idh/MocA family oxidoreductase [Melioribacteraceae bacterium]|nr:Gfo/Idh/MocA family oxidoreductase [Melioribacteraceae bacterium]MCF8353543.1 Gfo/Idh/MocA family oxidoreductase [Melioribacteraceae bacterium]MCF8392523.1 Gfo/Idh/MocA family oxidoreductase [Melioribacteraceae bacterium]MCF8418462.1 Gfo/Idh/MocA family oxidoreductase [Melioribacteraceae bacterium]